MNDLIGQTSPIAVASETMTSSQLAEMLGKEKKEINRNIKEMFPAEVDGGVFSPSIDSRGYVIEYHLPETDSIMFVAKHDIQYLRKISEYWKERNAIPLHTDPIDAMLLGILKARQELAIVKVQQEITKNGLVALEKEHLDSTARMDVYESRRPYSFQSGETTLKSFSIRSPLAHDVLKLAAKHYAAPFVAQDSYTVEGIPTNIKVYKRSHLATVERTWFSDSKKTSSKQWTHSSGKTFRPAI